MARNFFRIFTENNPVMGYSKTFFIPEAKGLITTPHFVFIFVQAAAIVPDNRPDKDWPMSGRVEINEYCVRYREGLDLALKGISCNFKAKEKVGMIFR